MTKAGENEFGSVGESPAPATPHNPNMSDAGLASYVKVACDVLSAERLAAPPESATDAFVAELRGHYDSDYDTTIPGLEFDAELGRIVKKHTAALQAKVSTLEQALLELRTLIDKARRFTASDPDNQWCRQATIILNYAMTGKR